LFISSSLSFLQRNYNNTAKSCQAFFVIYLLDNAIFF
jgi:hypothetical protein